MPSRRARGRTVALRCDGPNCNIILDEFVRATVDPNTRSKTLFSHLRRDTTDPRAFAFTMKWERPSIQRDPLLRQPHGEFMRYTCTCSRRVWFVAATVVGHELHRLRDGGGDLRVAELERLTVELVRPAAAS